MSPTPCLLHSLPKGHAACGAFVRELVVLTAQHQLPWHLRGVDSKAVRLQGEGEAA